MNLTYRAWRAGFTRRWHTNFDLCDTVDYDAGHQGRVCILVLKLFPDASRALIVRALTHDQGEIAAGDAPYPTKKANPAFDQMLKMLEEEEIEKQGLEQPELTVYEAEALRLCDWLDAWLWMVRFASHLRHRPDWTAQLLSMIEVSDTLGVKNQVIQLTQAAKEGK